MKKTRKMNNKIFQIKGRNIPTIAFLVLALGLLLPLISAEVQSLGVFKQKDCISLQQSCSNCTYNNITTIVHPNGQVTTLNKVMTKSGTNYNYTFCTTDQIGNYIASGIGDVDGILTIWAYDFEITPSGIANTLGFYFLILILSAGMIVSGFVIKDAWITIMGTFGLYFLGIYTIINGIAGIRDMVTTWALGIIVLGIAGYISVNSAIEVIEEQNISWG